MRQRDHPSLLKRRSCLQSKFKKGIDHLKGAAKKTRAEAGHESKYHPLPEGRRRVHIGCGENRLEGWVNVDISEDSGADLLHNVADGSFPFEDGSIDVIHSEDFIEHIPLDSGGHFLRECYRVLKPGGYMRLLTPDLLGFARNYLNRDEEHFKWFADNFQCRTWAEAFNFGMRMGGHTFLYDEETLDLVLKETGFEVMPVKPNESECPDLRGIDIRLEGITIYRDCRKPEAPAMP